MTAPLDGKVRTIIRFDAGFLWLKTVPGRHNLEWDKFSWLGELLQDQDSFPFVCKEGQITFIKGSRGWVNAKLQLVSEEEGKKAVRDKALIEHFLPESTGRNDN